ncbi:MAG: response regulator [candidate division Zixibacteria bacterium]|nr:response regulator [candidate division Zixibacteria bacterium]
MERKTILVVDDDEAQRFLCREILTDEGYDVLLAENGRKALEMIEDWKPDLVILDIVMPTMDGMEALPQILRKHRKTPVILNTSYARYRDHFISWAADAYVLKSPVLGELKEKVKELLSARYCNWTTERAP